jgi:hypothetical protein
MVNGINCRKPTACSAANLAAVTAERPWGANNPVWRLFAYGPLADLLPAPAAESSYYIVVLVADDGAENDGDPLRDGDGENNPGAGVMALRAEAFGSRGSRQIVEMTLARLAASQDGKIVDPQLQVLSWRLVR